MRQVGARTPLTRSSWPDTPILAGRRFSGFFAPLAGRMVFQPQRALAATRRRLTMTRSEVLDLLRTHKPVLVERFDVTELAVFGSFARDATDDESDIDVLVGFAGPATASLASGCSSISKICWVVLWTW